MSFLLHKRSRSFSLDSCARGHRAAGVPDQLLTDTTVLRPYEAPIQIAPLQFIAHEPNRSLYCRG